MGRRDRREDALKEVAGVKVTEARDYVADTVVNYVTGETGKTGLPSSNVLYYQLEDGTWF